MTLVSTPLADRPPARCLIARRRFLLLAALVLGPLGAAARPPAALAYRDDGPLTAPVYDPPATDPASPAATPVPTNLAGVVNSALAEAPGTYGVAVRDLRTGQTVLIRPDDFFPSASLYKLAVMYEVFRQQAAGSLSFGETLTVQPEDYDEADDEEPLSVGDQVTVQKALQLMIDVSSNDAAHVLADRVGWDQINDTMATLGLNHTRVPVGTWKAQMTDWRATESATSPADMLAFFDRLYHHQLVSHAASDQMIQLLLNQEVNDRMPADLPPNTRVAHKTGILDGIVNDAGIVYGPRSDFIVVVLAQDVDDADAATTAEARLAQSVYQYLNPT